MQDADRVASPDLPIVRQIGLCFFSSIIIGLLVIVASTAGLLQPSLFYPTEELVQAALPNDVANLAVGLSVLVAALWLTRRRHLFGLLAWPAAFLYILDNYIVSLLSLPFSW